MIGVHRVDLVPDDDVGVPVDVTCYLDEVSIHHGRESTDDQPEASTATLDLSLDTDVDPFPAALDVGSVLRVFTTLAGLDHVRFVGRVTDITMSWDEAGPETPNRVVAQLVAASSLADLGRTIVGDTPWPQERDGVRVARILELAGVPPDYALSDPGTLDVLPRDVDSQPALGLCQEVADSALGILYQRRDGTVLYADAEHRRGVTAALTLDSCDLLVSPQWIRNTAGLTTKVAVAYGVADDTGDDGGGDQPQVIVEIPARHRYDRSLTTVLAARADAEALANLILVRNKTPVWMLEALPVDVAGLDTVDTAALLDLDVSSLLAVTGLPVAGSAPTSTSLWVEGWQESLRWGEHELTLTVSGYCRTAPPPRWDDVAPSTTWDTFTPPGTTWDQATCFGPGGVDYGRWADVPASTRWDGVDQATTWDTWTADQNLTREASYA